MDCVTCSGNGEIECYKCNGKSTTSVSFHANGYSYEDVCENCNGTGYVICHHCFGNGSIE